MLAAIQVDEASRSDRHVLIVGRDSDLSEPGALAVFGR
jgi:hypothetical protein